MSWIPIEILSLIGGAIAGYLIARSARSSARLQERPASAEPARAAGDDSFEQLLRGLPIAAFLVDRGGRLAFVNDSAASLFSIDARRVGGRALIEVIPSIQLERLVRRALAGENASGTLALRRFAAETAIGINALPVAERGVLVFGEDRTELAAVEHVRREFLADVSHELRTPISAIRLMIETIQLAGGDPEAIALFLPKIATELERMTNLVEDLLELARNESGQVRLERSNVDLRALVEDAVERFRARADSLGIDLRLEPGPAIEAEVDPERLVQVVVNLVDNALRHTRPAGHVRVTLQLRGGEALIEVRDDGVGIPFKDLPHVFERFYVVDRSRARGSSGTGLGLAIVKQIVEAHGGEVSAESELDNGATFTCRLPLSLRTQERA